MFQTFGHSHPRQKLAPEGNTFNGGVEMEVLFVIVTSFLFFSTKKKKIEKNNK